MQAGQEDRRYWVESLTGIARPVMEQLARRQLRAAMPVECAADDINDRPSFSHLEAFGRTMTGLAPWLETPALDPEEERLRQEFAHLARLGLDAATDPDSPDYMNFSYEFQPIVDAAFLAHAILRAPGELWDKLDTRIRENLVAALKETRSRKPFFCNWLLFAAMIETALRHMGADWDPMRIDYALRQHEQWYAGDGAYGDGPEFHWDYYNSFVIQPMLVDIVRYAGSASPDWAAMAPAILRRAVRYGGVLEHFIAPDGTFPPIGRSLAYRFGAMQHLSQMALQHTLPQDVFPSQVRCALTAVIRRTLAVPGTFDDAGWLRIGFTGSQRDVAERYISTGSLYLCTAVFLPLGLPAGDEFWADGPREWTSVKMWSGQPAMRDHALGE